MPLEVKRFYTEAEISAELLDGMIDESVERTDLIFDYLDVRDDYQDRITVTVMVQQLDEPTPLVGYAERTPLTKGYRADSLDAYPVHLKEGYPFYLDSPHLVREGDDYGVTAEGLDIATRHLERNRIAMLRMIWMTVLGEKTFTWKQQQSPNQPVTKLVTLPYEDSFQTIPAPGTGLDDENSKIYVEIDKAMESYYDAVGFFPDINFCAPVTFNTIKGHPSVYQKIRPLQSSDPDLSLEARDSLLIGGLLFVAVRGKYYDADKNLKASLPEGLGVMTTSGNLSDGRGALRWEKVQNVLNAGDASRARYESEMVSRKPPQVNVDFYDNGVPVLPHREAVGHWQMYPTP